MSNRILNKVFQTILFFFIVALAIDGQVVVERSKDKVIISGTPYYVHIVKKGETSYSISRAYNVTVEELVKENPPAVYGINEGQALRMPVRDVEAKPVIQAKTNQVKKDETRFIYHKLQPGETVYSLSKLYGVSENEIISSNPRIDITKLSVDAEIAVPRRDFMTDRQEFEVQQSDYIFHKVVRGESISSIADKYGISVRELRKENRNIRFPQVGDYLRIPVAGPVAAAEVPVAEPLKIDTVKPLVDSLTVVLLPRPAGFTQVRNLSGSFDVAVLLPFYIRENAVRTFTDSTMTKGRKSVKLNKRPDEWIYPRSIGFVEMYEGILLACDTLRSAGLDINLHVYDIKSDTIELTRIINRGDLSVMDLIIGPVSSYNLAIVSAYAAGLGIPVVSPVQLFNNSVLVNNPELFIASPSLEVAQNTIARKASEYFNGNFVFIHSDTTGMDPDVTNFKQKIITELSNRLPFEEIRFKEFVFYSRSAFDNDSINRLGHALSKEKENIIIIASENDPVISETLQEIHGLSKKYPVKVFGYPVILSIDNLEPKFIFDLDILLYSPYWIDYTKRDVRQFNSDFRQKFLTQPSEMSYAWLGYDIAYYFLSGMAIHGKDFLVHPEIHYPDLLETQFDFRRETMSDGFENQKLFPVRFTKDYEVKLEPDNTPLQ
jgi:LysM repeat protein